MDASKIKYVIYYTKMEIVKKNRPRNLGDEDVGVLGEIIIEEPEQLNSSQYQKRNTYLPESKLFEPIGILDPEGKNVNPLTGEPYKNIYFKDPNKEFSLDNATYDWFAMNPKGWAGFPMYKEPKEKALKAFYNNQVTLIISGTGSGKTVHCQEHRIHPGRLCSGQGPRREVYGSGRRRGRRRSGQQRDGEQR